MSERRLGELYQNLRASFKEAGLDKAGLEAFLLLEWAGSFAYKDIFADPDRILDAQLLAKVQSGFERRLLGESIHRIRGWREFYGLPFYLSSETLEPRSDSEALIDLILPRIEGRAIEQLPRKVGTGFEVKNCGKNKGLERSVASRETKAALAGQEIRLLDMGTGSGALAIALLAQVPPLQAVGVDIAPEALRVAARNAQSNGVEARFQPLLSDWFDKVAGAYDFIISNPPYIVRSDIDKLDKTVRDFDPILALDGGNDGLDFYRLLASQSRPFLAPSGQIAVEIGFGQKTQVTSLFAKSGFHLVDEANDLSGICRALLFERAT